MQVRRIANMLAVGAIVVGTTTACATKKFVRTEVETVGTRVETLSQSLEATQQAPGRMGRKSKQWTRRPTRSESGPRKPRPRPATANTAVAAAETKLGTKIDAVDASTKRLVYEVVISEDQGQFKFGSAALPETVQQRIDQMVAELKAKPRGNFVEIEGHTDSSGDKMVNQRIGEARAEAVKRYLYEAHQVPLHKMNVISWGEDKPVSPNNTRDGRAQNRRVVIRVLA